MNGDRVFIEPFVGSLKGKGVSDDDIVDTIVNHFGHSEYDVRRHLRSWGLLP
jgi:hypothetical protein